MYHPIVTHDIDRYYKWHSLKSFIGESLRLLKGNSRWSWSEMKKSYRARTNNDPFSNIRHIVDLDQKAGVDSVFYMMTTEAIHPKNINDYSITDAQILADLKYAISEGCEVGLHPGYLTSENKTALQQQKEKLEEALGQSVEKSRQHYLHYSMPTTFQYLADIGIKNDSSIHPTDKYDTYEMKSEDGLPLGIKQTPLVFMDTHYMSLSDDKILEALEQALYPAKNNGGEVMVLWHNNNISNDREIWLYKEALQIIKA